LSYIVFYFFHFFSLKNYEINEKLFEQVAFKIKENEELVEVKYGYSFSLGIEEVVAFATKQGTIYFTAKDLHIIRCLLSSPSQKRAYESFELFSCVMYQGFGEENGVVVDRNFTFIRRGFASITISAETMEAILSLDCLMMGKTQNIRQEVNNLADKIRNYYTNQPNIECLRTLLIPLGDSEYAKKICRYLHKEQPFLLKRLLA
jgi:hypothetical protein